MMKRLHWPGLGRLGQVALLLGCTLTGTAADRVLRIAETSIARGQTNCIPILLEAAGDENAVGLSVCFDTNALRFISVRSRSLDSSLTLNVNSNQAAFGRLGLAASLGFGQSFPAGTHTIADICFRAAAGEGITTSAVSFCDLPIGRELSDVDANSLPATYAGSAVTLVGSCRYSLESTGATFSSPGGLGAGTISASPGCAWTVANSNLWIAVSTPAGGQGSGAFSYVVSPNPSPLDRTGTVWAAGQPYRIVQQGVYCDFQLSTGVRFHPPEGGPGQVNLTGNSACPWTVQNPNTWITLTSAAGGSGDGTLQYLLSPHTGFLARTGLVTVAGLTLTIVQLPVPCSFALSPTSRVHNAISEFTTVDVSGPAGCDWTIDNRNDWILIKLTTNGTGDGLARYTVLANDRPVLRSGIITIAGLPFTVQQLPAPCSLSLLSTGTLIGALGSTGMVQFATLDECPWTAINTNAWIELPRMSSGVGGGSLGWSVGPNFSSSERTGFINLGGKPYRITQYPTLCNSSISPTSRSIASGTNAGSVSVSVASACSNVQWRVYNPNPWITIQSGLEGYQKGAVSYTVEAFQDYGTRTGYLHIADRRFTLVQAGIPCSYAFSPVSRSHSYLPETNSLAFTVSGQCSWRASTSAPWVVLHSATNGNGSATLVYRTLLNTGAIRSATITAQGQTFTVSQAAATPVSLTTQPVPQDVAEGGTARFSVVAAGTAPLTYQWRRNGTNLTDRPGLSGATTPTLTLSNVQAGQAGTYSVVVANLRGSLASAGAALRVNQAPALDPIPPQTAVPGAVVAFTAQATDPDVPAQAITYSLGSDAPAGATIDPVSGLFTWTVAVPSTPRTLAITIRATDSGMPALSDVRTFTLQVNSGYTTNLTLVSFGATWHYRDTGEDLGTAWTQPDYNDQPWAAGPAPLGYGNGNEGTVVSYGPSPTARYITTYFRHHFQVQDPEVFTCLTLRCRRDDGVVFHLNGVELFRDNMPTGLVTYATLAASGIGAAEEAILVVSPPLDPGWLRRGDNVLAVEVHNKTVDNADIAIDAEVTGMQEVSAPTLVAQPADLVVTEGEPARFEARAASALPTTHQWFFHGNPLPGRTNSVLDWSAASPDLEGPYSVLIANTLGSVTSQVATLTVVPIPNRPPVIAPVGLRFIAPSQTLQFQVYAFDQDVPPQALTFNLEPGNPAGARIDPRSGLFSWMPAPGSPTTNFVTVRVTDSGLPPQSTLLSFQAIVVAPPRLLGVNLAGGRQPILTWESQPGRRYQIEEAGELSGNWQTLPGDATANGQATSFAAPIPPPTAGQRFYRVRVVQ